MPQLPTLQLPTMQPFVVPFRRFVFVWVALSWLGSGSFSFADDPKTVDSFEEKSVSMIQNGSLEGWEGDDSFFRIENGCIVAGTMKNKIEHNQFLCTTKSYGDFEMRVDVKLVGPGQNAGIQFRSERVKDSTEVCGYQADAGVAWKRPVWGGLYDESRRRKMLVMPDEAVVKKALKPDDWNELRIIADGEKIEVYVNGIKTTDYTEEDKEIAKSGIIGLQIHSGPASEAWYRNPRIAER